MKSLLLLSFMFSSVCFAQDKVVYGDDNRKDIFEEQDQARRILARSVAAKIPNLYMRLVRKDYTIRTVPLTDRGVCATERFAHQTTAAFCTGFLIAPDVLVTAGHCVKDRADCQGSKWVFDYKVENATQEKVSVPKQNVFECQQIIAQKFEQAPGQDYAVIKLKKKIKDRPALRFRTEGRISTGTPLFVIGHPSGLPQKIADGANVRSLDVHWFVANLDTFAGNSGSPVFNALTNEIEGILVRGADDYKDSGQGCKVVNTCPNDGCRGEDVTYITDVPLKLRR